MEAYFNKMLKVSPSTKDTVCEYFDKCLLPKVFPSINFKIPSLKVNIGQIGVVTIYTSIAKVNSRT